MPPGGGGESTVGAGDDGAAVGLGARHQGVRPKGALEARVRRVPPQLHPHPGDTPSRRQAPAPYDSLRPDTQPRRAGLEGGSNSKP